MHAALQDAIVPLARPHVPADSPTFTPLEVEAVAKHFATTFFQHYHLYMFVLTQPRPTEYSSIEDFVETMYMPPFHGPAVPGMCTSLLCNGV
jgi:hypothetical protein